MVEGTVGGFWGVWQSGGGDLGSVYCGIVVGGCVLGWSHQYAGVVGCMDEGVL